MHRAHGRGAQTSVNTIYTRHSRARNTTPSISNTDSTRTLRRAKSEKCARRSRTALQSPVTTSHCVTSRREQIALSSPWPCSVLGARCDESWATRETACSRARTAVMCSIARRQCSVARSTPRQQTQHAHTSHNGPHTPTRSTPIAVQTPCSLGRRGRPRAPYTQNIHLHTARTFCTPTCVALHVVYNTHDQSTTSGGARPSARRACLSLSLSLQPHFFPGPARMIFLNSSRSISPSPSASPALIMSSIICSSTFLP